MEIAAKPLKPRKINGMKKYIPKFGGGKAGNLANLIVS
jgi:hypothetical protein